MSDRRAFYCRQTFGMEMHQAKHLLETFTTATIAEDFLLSVEQVTDWRRRLGIPPMRRGTRKANGARRSMGPGLPMRAFG